MIDFLLNNPAYAHGDAAHHAAEAVAQNLWQWNHQPGLFAFLSLVALVYGLSIGPYRASLAPGEPFPTRPAIHFFLALSLFYIAVSSPIDAIGEQYLFSVHMFQHNLLIYPIAMGLLKGIPQWLAEVLLARPVIEPLARFLTNPFTAFLAFNLTFGIWHFPYLYELALKDQLVHDLEHLTFLGTAVLMWAPILNPIKAWRLSYGMQMLYLLALVIGQSPVFAYVTFAKSVHYPTYEAALRLLPVSALEDQVLGGALMKIVGMGVMTGALYGAFINWYKEDKASALPDPEETAAADQELVARGTVRFG